MFYIVFVGLLFSTSCFAMFYFVFPVSSPSDQGNWAPRIGALAGFDRGAVSLVALHHGGESPGDVLAGQGGADNPCGKGGGGEEGGGNEDGGGDEEGQKSPVDGVFGWPRLGKEGRLPQDAFVILQLCFLF